MYSFLTQGFLLGLAYVAPIGMQNLNVINTALSGNKIKAYQVAFATIFFDITLALACFWGIGILINNIPILRLVILFIGSLLIIYIGISIIRSSNNLNYNLKANQPLTKIIVSCFVVTWLNPQAIIDGSMLLGGYYASVPSEMASFFITGFCAASIFWFLFIAVATLKLRSIIGNGLIKKINIICGIVLILFGGKLGYHFLKLI